MGLDTYFKYFKNDNNVIKNVGESLNTFKYSWSDASMSFVFFWYGAWYYLKIWHCHSSVINNILNVIIINSRLSYICNVWTRKSELRLRSEEYRDSKLILMRYKV